MPLPPGATLAEPEAVASTDPVATDGDSADDPAIWVHPQYPSQSLVFGTNKRGGLEWYGLDGKRLGIVSDTLEPDNVDLAYSVRLGSRTVDVLGAAVRGAQKGFMLWIVEPETRRAVPAQDAAFPVFGGGMPYGSALYRRARDGALYAFVNDKQGRVEQYLLDGASGTFVPRLVRSFDVGDQVEGCVADDERGSFFISEEQRAIWRYDAEPDAPATEKDRVAILEVGQTGVVPDLEGLTIYYGKGGKGYLIASVQGADRFFVFDREPPYTLRKVIDPRGSKEFGDVQDTDGIAAESFGLGKPFERGLFVAQDGKNGKSNQDFKLYAWSDIAGVDLLVEFQRDPRKPHWLR
ncbi:MAG: phytase [Planctomycetota bacterium]|nr:phytase [Planctomycetota bacterium]